LCDRSDVMTASTSTARDQVSSVRKKGPDDVEVLENGGLSPQPSVRTDADDDACSEIVRIEQENKEEENGTAVGRIVKTIQVSGAGSVV